jgi:hypothetical protein
MPGSIQPATNKNTSTWIHINESNMYNIQAYGNKVIKLGMLNLFKLIISNLRYLNDLDRQQ